MLNHVRIYLYKGLINVPRHLSHTHGNKLIWVFFLNINNMYSINMKMMIHNHYCNRSGPASVTNIESLYIQMSILYLSIFDHESALVFCLNNCDSFSPRLLIYVRFKFVNLEKTHTYKCQYFGYIQSWYNALFVTHQLHDISFKTVSFRWHSVISKTGENLLNRR